MTLSNFVPLVVATIALTVLGVSRVHNGVDRVLTRIAIRVFGGYVSEFRSEHPDRQNALRKAHFATTYREYGSKTLLYAAVVTVVGSVFGMYAIWGLLTVFSVDPDVLRESLPDALAFVADVGGVPALSVLELFALITASSLTIGFVSGGVTAWLRWWYPSYVAGERARQIETALPTTIAFVYALSKSGMGFPTVVRIVAENEDTYGAAAEEFGVAVRNMDTFGMDVVSAVEAMGQRSASPQLSEFSENLVSVLQSGQSLSAFLEREYHDYQEEAESQQESMLEMLGTLAEAYVTVLVAGPLFLITILVVIGFAVNDTLEPLRVLIYVILPFGNLAFMVYLSMVTDSINPSRADTAVSETPRASDVADVTLTDGGTVAEDTKSANLERLRLYRRFESIRNRVGRPGQTLLERPKALLTVTVPVAALAILWQTYGAYTAGTLSPEAVDTVIALAGIFVAGTFAVVYELHRRRINAIEAAIPDLLDRLASVNEAGMPIITAIDHVRGSDLGELSVELDRIWTDIEWGADLEAALYRFSMRTRTQSISRVVTLLTEAMNASGQLSTVLKIAAKQASAARRLKRERKQAMVEYMVVVYVAFLVFLFIIVVLSAYLLPNLPTEGVEPNGPATASGGGIGALTDMSDFDIDAYNTVFFHATFIQGMLSGFIAGQLSSGDVKAGAKHATLMMTAAFVLFVFVL